MSDKIDLSKMEKKIIIRNVEEKDIDDIVELSKICFPNMEPWTRAHLKSHIDIFNEGQFCVEYDGKIIGRQSWRYFSAGAVTVPRFCRWDYALYYFR